ncbi:hypothetical protein [Sedimentitalea nanhaiensis]|uniref:Uncharacterized protein n=1 Tax=Sedimentitalea nanhaiensis TaxID=999627 RepID=A0A1I6YTY1_9RHOB|nr:hypothetical protein [Sedimentitalea nanhaiensis]SFT53940.1 hypothetical protein SAMN05216236_10325 [Sedimentitalea nanhaiensis]
MAYATISTWKLNETPKDEDAMWQAMQDQYVPMNLALGSTRMMIVQTGEGESAIIQHLSRSGDPRRR